MSIAFLKRHQIFTHYIYIYIYPFISRAKGVYILRMLPHSAFHYMTYEQYRGLLHYKCPSVGTGPLLDILAGSADGGTSFLCTYPLDLAGIKYAY